MIILNTDRLILRTIDYSFASRVLEYYVRNKEFLESWEAIKEEKFYTLDFQRKLLINEENFQMADRSIRFWIFKKEDKGFGRIIGSIGLSNIVRGCFLSCFLGYKLDKDEVRKGYMTEAIGEVVNYAFNRLNLHRIEANIMPRNKASLAVVRKHNFIHEGYSKKYLRINGVWEDHLHMVLLNKDLE